MINTTKTLKILTFGATIFVALFTTQAGSFPVGKNEIKRCERQMRVGFSPR